MFPFSFLGYGGGGASIGYISDDGELTTFSHPVSLPAGAYGEGGGLNFAGGTGITEGGQGVFYFHTANYNAAFFFSTAAQKILVGTPYQYAWTSSNNPLDAGADTGIARPAPATIMPTNGADGGGSYQLLERTAPAAPDANNVVIYAEDNGAGKTKLMARFATGSPVQIAIEP